MKKPAKSTASLRHRLAERGIDASLLMLVPALVFALALFVYPFSYGIGLTFARRNLSGHEPLELAFGQLAAGAVLLAPFALLTSGSAHPTIASSAAILGIAIFSTAIAWPLLFRLNRQVGPLATSTIPFLNPIFGVLWGALFLHEVVTFSLLGGGLLVFIALALILDIRPRRAARVTPAS